MTWGEERIAAELLLKIGVEVSPRTMRRYIRRPASPRLVGTIRRECLDFLIPLNERHVRRILKEWAAHYSHGRPHARLHHEYRLELAA